MIILLCSQGLERAVRRLFKIPDSQTLIMATELKSTGYKRLDIDPKTWPIIKDSVAAVWIRKSLTSASPANDTKGSEDPVCIMFNGGAWEVWSFLMPSFSSGKRAEATSPSSSIWILMDSGLSLTLQSCKGMTVLHIFVLQLLFPIQTWQCSFPDARKLSQWAVSSLLFEKKRGIREETWRLESEASPRNL